MDAASLTDWWILLACEATKLCLTFILELFGRSHIETMGHTGGVQFRAFSTPASADLYFSAYIFLYKPYQTVI